MSTITTIVVIPITVDIDHVLSRYTPGPSDSIPTSEANIA
jgi:hypothetical protein